MSRVMLTPDLAVNMPGMKSNLWSLKARQDIFERRQKGEDWETICKDYPNRTRHAMQQQYSVMKKQKAPDSPRFVSNRRGRKTRGTTRSRWATVNRSRSTSEDGLESDHVFDVEEIDEEDDEELDSEEPAAEESSHVADEDVAVEDDASHEHSTPAPALGRSATEPSTTYSNLPRRATFPNLPGFAVPATPAPTAEDKALPSEHPKRKVNGEATDSESRSSSHISKRRKHSTEPAESVNPAFLDPLAPPKALGQSLNMSGMIFYPEAIAQATENFRTLSRAVLHEQASRKDTFEAALRRANRRVNDAEHRLQDISQNYADKLKAKEEVFINTIDSLRAESAALSTALTESRESFQTLSESSSRQAALDDKHAQLARFDELLPLLTNEATKLSDCRKEAVSRAAAIIEQHDALNQLIRQFLENIEEVSMKRLKGYGIEIQDQTRALGDLIRGATGCWSWLGKLTDVFWNGFKGLSEVRTTQREEENHEIEAEATIPRNETEVKKQKDDAGQEKMEKEKEKTKEQSEQNEGKERNKDQVGSKGEQRERRETNNSDIIPNQDTRIPAIEEEKNNKSREPSKESFTRHADDRQPMELDIETKKLRTEEETLKGTSI